MTHLTDDEIRERLRRMVNAPLGWVADVGDGTTLLMHVHSAELAKLLIAAGAEVNARDDDGATPLIHASGEGHAMSMCVTMKA